VKVLGFWIGGKSLKVCLAAVSAAEWTPGARACVQPRRRHPRNCRKDASDALIAAGGTVTHYHAVGRDHMARRRTQCPARFAKVLAAAKIALDPGGILNPQRHRPVDAFAC
jgi:hypothetical protein